MPIRVLDPQVAAKIAAGEVVERPASVVKELVENAIDAGATMISVELQDGGYEMIRVVDNGCGIASSEMALAFQHHATSKINSLEDLQAVRTLGFRGEALYSIAAVAQVKLVSRTAGDLVGAYVEIADGRVLGSGARGSPLGTTVSVRHLFYNVPARRKFLKSAEVEGGRVVILMNQFALAYPEIQFHLISNGRQVFQSTGSGSLSDVLVKVLGLDMAREMIPLDPRVGQETGTLVLSHGAAGPDAFGRRIVVSGCVSQPHVTRANRQYLSFFVNRRWVQSPMLARAVEQAYHTLLPVGRHPIAVLDVAVPPDEVDVNVHPAKAEVKLLREGEVFVAVQRSVRSALTAHATIPAFSGATEQPARLSGAMPMGRLFRVPDVAATPVAGTASEAYRAAEPAEGTMGSRLPPLRILGQMAQTYIVAEAPDGMYLIDQHTAHERVLYDRLMSEHARAAVKSQLLLEPLTIELTPRQQAMLQPRLEAFMQMGFDVSPFGERTYVIRSIPVVLQGGDVIQAVLEAIDLLADEKGAPGNWQEALYITIACHGAVRAGQALTLEEMRLLVTQLEQTEMPRTCPHGRPTLLHISQAQLEREFGRR